MSRKSIKRPNPSGGKNIVAPDQRSGSTNLLKPVFSFEYLVTSHSVDVCESDDRSALAVQLSKIGSLTWAELQGAHRHGLGYEKIAQTSMKVALPAIVTPDITLIAFRFNGKKPMIGYRSDQTFYILFLDSKYTCYKH